MLLCPRVLFGTAVVGFITLLPLAGQNAQTAKIQSARKEYECHNEYLSIKVNSKDGSYSISRLNTSEAVFKSQVGASINHFWIRSSNYPDHKVVDSDFSDDLGVGRQLLVTATGLVGLPDLEYRFRLYHGLQFGLIGVRVLNRTKRRINVEGIRIVEAVGHPVLNLNGKQSADRILSDSFSENRPALKIADLGQTTNHLHLGAGSQLVFNRESHESLFLGALTADRFLSVFSLKANGSGRGAQIVDYKVESTGTTAIQTAYLRDAPKGENRINLSVSVNSGQDLSSELLMFALGNDYHAQLEGYADAIRVLHHVQVKNDIPRGWWSWTAFYRDINQTNLLDNARQLSKGLRSIGYEYFLIDEGYEKAPGDNSVADRSKFPNGMRQLTEQLLSMNLKIGIWTAPFYIGEASSVYKNHKEWLVHNAKGIPICVVPGSHGMEHQRIFALDTTHPGAQQYLRELYQTLVREWHVHYIKLDFMDNTAIEGYRYLHNTTALEALKIGLKVIRQAVGQDVLLDKDGSPMLTPVGIVDEGRVSQDTGHTFTLTKDAASGIAARYYMHQNFFINDPDAFNISKELVGHATRPLSLNEARTSIVLAALAGGMFEIGDDLELLSKDPERLNLLRNEDLLAMARSGQAAKPLDLMTYLPEDEQPSIYLQRLNNQLMLAVFNWTDEYRSHEIPLSDLNIPSGRDIGGYDVFDQNRPLNVSAGKIAIANQCAHSVQLIKILLRPHGITD